MPTFMRRAILICLAGTLALTMALSWRRSDSSLISLSPFLSLPAYAQSTPTAESLREILVGRASQVSKFRARYHLAQKGYTRPSLTWDGRWHRLTVVDSSFLLEVDRKGKDGNLIQESFLSRDGLVSTFLTGDHVVHGGDSPSGMIGWPSFPIPKGAYVDPLMAFGNFDGLPLAERFEVGSLSTRRTAANTLVLTWEHVGTGRADFELDDQLRLVGFTFGTTPGEKNLKIFQYMIEEGIDPFNCSWSVHLSDFRSFDGVEIPLTITKKWYAGPELSEQTNQVFDHLGKDSLNREVDISHLEELFRATFLSPRDVASEQTATLQPETVEINPPLSVEDLKFEFPNGTVVNDMRTGIWFTVGENAEVGLDKMLNDVYRDIAASAVSGPATDDDNGTTPVGRPQDLTVPVSTARSTVVLWAIVAFAGAVAAITVRQVVLKPRKQAGCKEGDEQ